MTANKLPASGAEAWEETLRMLMRYRGAGSAKKLEAMYTPRRLGYQTIYRIMHLDEQVDPGSDDWYEKLATLSGMLELPSRALRLFYDGDRAALQRLTFDRPGGEGTRQDLLDALDEATNPPRNRRASDRKHANG